MRILFINGYAFLPQIVGGIEISTADLCLALKQEGHEPSVMCSLIEGNWLWLKNRIKGKLLRQNFPADQHGGLLIYRGWNTMSGLKEVTNRARPDAVVVQGGLYNSYEIAAECARLGLRTFYYTHDLGVVLSGVALPDMSNVTWIANSAFTARTLKKALDISCEIIPPLIRREAYVSDATGDFVTMINPRPEKGGELALQIAQLCPEIPFLFVEVWKSAHPDVQKLKQMAAQIPNVKWLPVQSNMRSIYGSTRLLLMPSQCHETWGRVITEAQFLGIPALASRMGALPETVGPAGEVEDADAPAARWAEKLRLMYSHEPTYRQYANAAKAYSAREEIAPADIAAKFAKLLLTPTAHNSAGV